MYRSLSKKAPVILIPCFIESRSVTGIIILHHSSGFVVLNSIEQEA